MLFLAQLFQNLQLNNATAVDADLANVSWGDADTQTRIQLGCETLGRAVTTLSQLTGSRIVVRRPDGGLPIFFDQAEFKDSGSTLAVHFRLAVAVDKTTFITRARMVFGPGEVRPASADSLLTGICLAARGGL